MEYDGTKRTTTQVSHIIQEVPESVIHLEVRRAVKRAQGERRGRRVGNISDIQYLSRVLQKPNPP